MWAEHQNGTRRWHYLHLGCADVPSLARKLPQRDAARWFVGLPQTRPRMKLLFVIANLGMGGAERVITLLANGFAQRGYEVTLLAYAWDESPQAFEVSPEVRLSLLAARQKSGQQTFLTRFTRALRDNWHYLRAIRKTIRASKPQFVVSFVDYTNLRCILAATGTGVPVVISERIDPHCWPITAWGNYARNQIYPAAAALIILSQHALNYFPDRVRRRSRVIFNPVCLPDEQTMQVLLPTPPMRPRIIAAGRLAPQKGFDLALRAFAQIAGEFPEWHLIIFGEGRERPVLERLISDLKLSGRAVLPGKTDRIFAELAAADLFVLSSRFEGFPNVLIEAMAMGVPCITFDCPSGPREIIRDGVDGVLVPPEDVDALAGAMVSLMRDGEARRRLGEAAREIRHRLSLDTILDQWAALFKEVVQNSRREPRATDQARSQIT